VRRLCLPLVALLVLVAAGCDFPSLVPTGNDSSGTVPVDLRYRDPVFADVTVTNGVSYGTATNLAGEQVDLQLDVYQPTGDTVTNRPAVVWVHGGSFCCGDRTSGEIVDEATTFAKKGYVNVSIEYRLEQPGCSGNFSNCVDAIREATEDAQTAVRFLRTNAQTYGVDPDRIAIGGSSAGAITALNVAASTSEDPAAGVRAAVSISGAQIVAGTISAGDAPILDFHCTTDPLVNYSWMESTLFSARAAGLDAFLETWDDTCHVPYEEHRDQILDHESNFLYWEMDLSHAAT
jgi:acetyl esterase/lipase